MVFFKRTLRTLSLAVLLASVVEWIPQSSAAAKKAGKIAAPAIVPAGGIFTSNVSVTLTGATKEIRYTLDGSEPGTNSPLYTAPLVLTNTALVKARGFASPAEAGPVEARVFTFLDTNVAAFNSSLPLIVINTFGTTFPTPSNATHWMQVFNVSTNQRATLLAGTEFSGPVNLKPRGYTSRRYPKRSLTVETMDAEGEEVDVPLLGMPAESDWVLYAPYIDKTMLRDVLAYELSNKTGHYASRTRFVEVFINESTNQLARTHYAGIYVLEEKVKISPHRVAIHKMKASDNAEPNVTGGYLFKKDHLEKARGEASDTPVRPRIPSLPVGYPTGPGGFPALASGFLAPAEPAAFTDALAIITNNAAITNVVSGTNIVLPPPTVSIVKMNSLIVTNALSVTNSIVTTNLVVTTNHPVVTNVTVTSTPVIVTNAVVASQAVAGTNTVATTNHVDGTTAVITTTTTVTTSSTYRTNYIVATNTLVLTNSLLVTNMVVATNSIIVTNIAITTVPIFSTNKVVVTNYYRLGPADISPYAEMLLTSGEGFVTSNANPFFLVEPKPTKITPAQRSWLTNYLNRFEAALYGPDFRNPTNGYAAFIDVDSFIDNHLFVEATKNIDGYRFSTYFTKDRGGKLKMEPVWDWNLSLGNARGKQGYMFEHWYWPQLDDQQYSWYRRLFEDPDFGQRYVDRWAQWRTNIFATSNLLARIDSLAAGLKEPAARNFERWPILGSIVDREYYAGKTWEEDIQYLKTWTSNRLAWIDAQFVPPPVVTRAPVTPAPTNTIHFVAPTGQVYFTTDGTDPRLTNGNVSSTAKVYQAPVAVPKATKVVARTRNNNGWSSPIALRMEE